MENSTVRVPSRELGYLSVRLLSTDRCFVTLWHTVTLAALHLYCIVSIVRYICIHLQTLSARQRQYASRD